MSKKSSRVQSADAFCSAVPLSCTAGLCSAATSRFSSGVIARPSNPRLSARPESGGPVSALNADAPKSFARAPNRGPLRGSSAAGGASVSSSTPSRVKW